MSPRHDKITFSQCIGCLEADVSLVSVSSSDCFSDDDVMTIANDVNLCHSERLCKEPNVCHDSVSVCQTRIETSDV